MKKKILISLLFAVLFVQTVCPQRVGLVLSGGGAKGMTHIGIIRALEENGIPIDYVTGTSMGAIISSLYAMGYSPDEMFELIKSPNFKRWYTGEIETHYQYYFKQERPTPEFFNLRFFNQDSLKRPTLSIPTSVVPPIQMNLVFLELFGQATATCRGDFDKLFVPFRCVASDVYHKRAIVLRRGDLGDAVRSSMSFPFVFKPIEIDQNLVYDGGIYNNFPTDVMMEDFKPDIMIGSVVSSNPEKPKIDDFMSQIENMVMQKTDYDMPDSLGFLLRFRYDDVSLLSFDRLQELHDIGYNRTMELMDSIKARIPRRVREEELRAKRAEFKRRMPPFSFSDIVFEGVSEREKSYLRKEFRFNADGFFDYEEFKRTYFRLLAGKMVSEITPHAVYHPTSGTYTLHLKVKMNSKLTARIGGNISTTSSNQIYLGTTYKSISNIAKEITLDGQIGKIYNNVQLMGRFDFIRRVPFALRLIGSVSTFDYYKKDKLFSQHDNPTFNASKEYFAKALLSLPYKSNRRMEFGFGIGRLVDYYYKTSIVDYENSKRDKSLYNMLGLYVGLNGSTLNARQYATRGQREQFWLQGFRESESFYLEDNPVLGQHIKPVYWAKLSVLKEMYHPLSDKFTLGWMAQAVYSTRKFSQNYTATKMMAPAFTPTPHSKIMYNEAFRANQFLAVGIRPIYTINDMFHIRSEFYVYAPFSPILCDSRSKAYYGSLFSKQEYIGELSVVCRLPFGAISGYVNHYSSPQKEWNVGISIGWQLFNYRFVE